MERIPYRRVRIKGTNVEKSIPEAKWEANRDLFADTRKPAVNSNGDPLPDEIVPASSGTKKSKSDDGQSADTTKES